jgi:hypothetical protein
MRERRRGSVPNVMCRYAFMGSAGMFIIGQRNLVRILRRPPIRT